MTQQFHSLSEENENSSLKRYMHHNIHSNIINNSQDMEATKVLINWRKNAEDLVYIHIYIDLYTYIQWDNTQLLK